MDPKLCPVCAGRGTVPEDLYNAPLGEDWEPGDLPPIRKDCREVECQTCEGLGVIWAPTDTESVFDADGEFTFATPTSKVYVTSSRMSYTDLYDWDVATSSAEEMKPSLSLVPISEDEDD